MTNPDELEGEEAATRTADTADKVAGVVIAVLYGFAVGVNVYLIVDQLTDGELSRECSRRWYKLRERTGRRRQVEATAKREAPYVVYEAIEITREAAGNES